MEASCGGRHERAVRATLKAAIWPERRGGRARARTRSRLHERAVQYTPEHTRRTHARTHALVTRRSWSVKELLKYNVKEGCRHGDDRLTASGVNNALCVPHVAPI